jgi:sigma-E factor negative regulatory protein RseA
VKKSTDVSHDHLAHQPPPGPADDAAAAARVRARLSALMDGAYGEDGLALGRGASPESTQPLNEALALWVEGADARRAWHRYHLIGDVMRSGDLAYPDGRDLKVLLRVSERLESEPVHLLPARFAASAVARPAPRSLVAFAKAGAALAASFVGVVLVLLLARGAGVGTEAAPPSSLAHRDSAAGVGTVVLRDPRMDEYLRLHHLARGGLAVVAPGGTLHRADLQLPVDEAR